MVQEGSQTATRPPPSPSGFSSPSPAPLPTPRWLALEIRQSAVFAEDVDEPDIATDPYADPVCKSRARALGYLRRARVENPHETLVRLYNECLPNEPNFADEIRAQKAGYEQSQCMKAYLKAVDTIVGEEDYDRFVDLYKQGRTEEDRQRLGGEAYSRFLTEISPFQVPTPEQYLDRYNDYPLDVHEDVRQRAYELAKTLTLTSPPRHSEAVAAELRYQQPEEPMQ